MSRHGASTAGLVRVSRLGIMGEAASHVCELLAPYMLRLCTFWLLDKRRDRPTPDRNLACRLQLEDHPGPSYLFTSFLNRRSMDDPSLQESGHSRKVQPPAAGAH
jgi:hypothetical protein